MPSRDHTNSRPAFLSELRRFAANCRHALWMSAGLGSNSRPTWTASRISSGLRRSPGLVRTYASTAAIVVSWSGVGGRLTICHPPPD